MSTGRDLSHWNKVSDYGAARNAVDWAHIKVSESADFVDSEAAKHFAGFRGKPRGPYHFLTATGLAAQIDHFLTCRNKIATTWERMDMLDCEYDGIAGARIKAAIAEWRKQTGKRRLYVYVGYADLIGDCKPETWWDSDVVIWAARYRKQGPPPFPDFGPQLQFDHRGLGVYQWDNEWPLSGAGKTDINYERLTATSGGATVIGDDGDMAYTLDEIAHAVAAYRTGDDPTDMHGFAELSYDRAKNYLDAKTSAVLAETKAMRAEVQATQAAQTDQLNKIAAAVAQLNGQA